MAKKKESADIIRSSAAEYLTFAAAAGDDKSSFEMRYEDENIWLTQKMMAELYGVSTAAISQHLKTVYSDDELVEQATIKEYLIVQNEGSRAVRRRVKHYNLQAIIAVGFKVNNERAVQFRKWANQIVKDYTIQGWVMDEDRLKNDGSVLTQEFFDRQVEKVREIRASERRFYQKITDIYATALDYDPSAKATKRYHLMNGKFCGEAWDTISRYVYAALQGGSIMKSWTNDDRMMIACRNDGTRPVIFKIERIDILENDVEAEWLARQDFTNHAEDAYTG
ncbi:RhuM family protein [Xiamenia xianingshaonis]|uniref:TIGR04076 family protein n=1 Tax=Xiamenia xianingshaonis TaxID=2682776 RepID=A0ABX0IJK7_9ACTN|nr:RhuM family protein [Xiamenia xianingshaonis]NHM15037.1 TIGR04076 family protein [Xiamenia xianingshaonis]